VLAVLVDRGIAAGAGTVVAVHHSPPGVYLCPPQPSCGQLQVSLSALVRTAAAQAWLQNSLPSSLTGVSVQVQVL
jgi:hypothetical protein